MPVAAAGFVSCRAADSGVDHAKFDTPESRAVSARKLIDQVGGSMEVFYWMFGEWDGFVVYEVGDSAMAAMFSGVATACGLIERVKTQQLLRIEEVHTALELARRGREHEHGPSARKGPKRKWAPTAPSRARIETASQEGGPCFSRKEPRQQAADAQSCR